jgi:ABC-type dipeptide/oligopeptide/nickel transport system permease subunit
VRGTLNFLGLGVLEPFPSWSSMLNDARGHLFDAPHMVVFPASAVMTAVLAFNMFGDACATGWTRACARKWPSSNSRDRLHFPF